MSWTVIMYTDNELPRQFERACFEQLHRATTYEAHNEPHPPQRIVVSTRPFKTLPAWVNIVEDGGERGLRNCYRKIMAGLSVAEERTVFLAEHDVLYPRGYFDFVLPSASGYYYNMNTWCQNEHGFFDRNRMLTSNVCADRDLLKRLFAKRIQMCDDGERIVWDEPGGNPGEFAEMLTSWCPSPVVDIRHGGNLTGQRASDNYVQALPPYGDHVALWASYGLGR